MTHTWLDYLLEKPIDTSVNTLWGEMITMIHMRQFENLLLSLLRVLKNPQVNTSTIDLEATKLTNLSKNWQNTLGNQYAHRKKLLEMFIGKQSFNTSQLLEHEFKESLLFNKVLNLEDLKLVLLCSVQHYAQEGKTMLYGFILKKTYTHLFILFIGVFINNLI